MLDAGQEVGELLQVSRDRDPDRDAAEIADGIVTHHLRALDLDALLAGETVQRVLQIRGGERRRVARDELRVAPAGRPSGADRAAG